MMYIYVLKTYRSHLLYITIVELYIETVEQFKISVLGPAGPCRINSNTEEANVTPS